MRRVTPVRCSAAREGEIEINGQEGKRGNNEWQAIVLTTHRNRESVCTDEQTMRGGWGSPNKGSEKPNVSEVVKQSST